MSEIKEFQEIEKTIDEALEEIKNSSSAELTSERGKTHGNFSDHARITRRLKHIMVEEQVLRHRRGQPALNYQQCEALDMIAHKIGRIIAGEASFQDHWDDIAGYAHIANKEF